MEKREFKAESKRLLDLMINSIYTNKDIFLRELISNASDAIDKIYYKALVDKDIEFNKSDYYIRIEPVKEERTLTIKDTGIGMSREELEENLGTIAKSGSFDFKENNEIKDGHDIIGQFGVGFYSAFMVADTVTVISKEFGSDIAYKWESQGADGFTIEEVEKDHIGTDIVLKLKENTEDENYDDYLDEYRIKGIVEKYSNFIRYPIKMDVIKHQLKEDTEDEYEEVVEEEVLNSMVPIWRKNKNELTEEDYDKFYSEKHYGFDKPLSRIHLSVDGLLSYKSLLYIPREAPYDFYTPEYEKGLELYSSGVLIMNKCAELIPDYFSFVKGVVDSEDLTLNISREVLQHDRQLIQMGNKIRDKVRDELQKILRNKREEYEKFFSNFGRQLKFGVYSDYGANKEILQDLLLFYTSNKEMRTFDEYVESMEKDQEFIYYATGESNNRIDKLPQVEFIKDKGYEILYLSDDIDEFAIKILQNYKDKEFKSVSSTTIEDDNEDIEEKPKEVFNSMKEILKDKVTNVKPTSRLKEHPVYLASEGEISIEMEKVLSQMPDSKGIKAEKVLEINTNHKVFERIMDAYENDKDKLELYTNLLYNQALLIEGLELEDPVEFTNNIWKLL